MGPSGYLASAQPRARLCPRQSPSLDKLVLDSGSTYDTPNGRYPPVLRRVSEREVEWALLQ